MQQKFCRMLLIFIGLANAANSNTTSPSIASHNNSSATVKTIINSGSTESAVVIGASNLANIDNNADDLIQLKRKLEVEKAQAEIKKFRGAGVNGNNSGSTIVQDNIQTTVTGVAINHEGRKIAWLQFADGGSLTVNIGSQVGKYIVSDITMNGVRLSDGRSKNNTILLKRAYYAPDAAKNKSSNSNKSFFSPSPIVTSANTGDGSDMVPPIVPDR